MSNLALRFLTAVVAIPLLLACIQWQKPYGVWVWVLFAQIAGLREWMNMTMPTAPAGQRAFGVVIGTLLGSLVCWVPDLRMLLAGVWGGTIAIFLFFLFCYRPIETVAARISATVAGVFYAGLLISPLMMFKLRPSGDGAAWIYICLSSAWLSDTGAYFAGRFLGPFIPAKLWAAISPKKTMIGGVGGLAGSLVALSVAKLWYLPMLSWLDVVAIAVPANLLGQLGDLCESLIKRSVGVKDSGVLLPGHGGMLDRIDALLLVVPYVYLYAQLRF
jgi:phosphatidate cytidylyltransferase